MMARNFVNSLLQAAAVGLVAQATAWSQSATSFGPGTHLVGIDIQAGLYRTEGPATYIARLSGLGGELSDIIANETSDSGPMVVEVKATDVALEVHGDGIWHLLDDSFRPEPKATFGDGWWIVGKDVLPGIYRTRDDVRYYARLSGFGHELEDIIANDASAEGGAVIEIKATDAGFETRGATWTLISLAKGPSAVQGTTWGAVKAGR
jgi:hypothetical protein